MHHLVRGARECLSGGYTATRELIIAMANEIERLERFEQAENVITAAEQVGRKQRTEAAEAEAKEMTDRAVLNERITLETTKKLDAAEAEVARLREAFEELATRADRTSDEHTDKARALYKRGPEEFNHRDLADAYAEMAETIRQALTNQEQNNG